MGVGFTIPKHDGAGGWVEYGPGEVLDDDWLCGGWCDMVMCLIGLRLVRCSYILWGVSNRIALWSTENMRQQKREFE